MWTKSLVIGLALSATHAAAFLVGPDSQADAGIVNALPLDAAASSQAQKLRLNCPGCPVHLRKSRHHPGSFRTQNDIPNHLELTFTIDSHSSDGDRLLVNDFELYPKTGAWYTMLRAPQILDFTRDLMNHPPVSNPDTPQLGYSLATRPVVKEKDGQQLELVDIDLQIIEVGNSFVNGIPNVNLKLIKTPAGKLMIASLKTTESETAADTPMEKQEDCATLYCRWRAAVMDKVKGLKHCGKGMGMGKGHPHPHPHGHMHGHHHHNQRPDQFKHHHTWGRLLKNITSGILLPVLIGLVAGISLSIIGMIVGTFFVCLWRVFVRRESPFGRRHRCRRHGCSRSAAPYEDVPSNEKTVLIIDEDVADLPPYRDEEEERKAAQ